MLKGIWLEKVHIGTLPGKQVVETSAAIEFSFCTSWTWQSIGKKSTSTHYYNTETEILPDISEEFCIHFNIYVLI